MPVRSATRALCLLAALAVAAGCDSGESFDVSDYVGTYTGTRSLIEGDTGSTDVQDVTFEISADEAAGTVALVLTSDFGPPERLTGTYDGDGLRVRVSQSGVTVSFDVAVDGDVTGTFEGFGQGGPITGQLTPTRFDLTFQPDDADALRTEVRTSR